MTIFNAIGYIICAIIIGSNLTISLDEGDLRGSCGWIVAMVWFILFVIATNQ